MLIYDILIISPPYIADEEEGVLDRPSCLAALAALRHTKWFQVCKNARLFVSLTHCTLLQLLMDGVFCMVVFHFEIKISIPFEECMLFFVRTYFAIWWN